MNFEEKGSISDVKDKKRFYYIEGLRLDLRDFLNVSCQQDLEEINKYIVILTD